MTPSMIQHMNLWNFRQQVREELYRTFTKPEADDIVSEYAVLIRTSHVLGRTPAESVDDILYTFVDDELKDDDEDLDPL